MSRVEEGIALPHLLHIVGVKAGVLREMRLLAIDLERVLVIEEFNIEAHPIHGGTLALTALLM
jgi:hypothetical protein